MFIPLLIHGFVVNNDPDCRLQFSELMLNEAEEGGSNLVLNIFQMMKQF